MSHLKILKAYTIIDDRGKPSEPVFKVTLMRERDDTI